MGNNISVQEMKEYLKMVFDLESSLYLNKKMRETYFEDMETVKPVLPKKRYEKLPIESKSLSENVSFKDYLLYETKEKQQITNVYVLFFGVIITLSMIAFQIGIAIDGYGFISFGYYVFLLALIAFTAFCFIRVKKDWIKINETHKNKNEENHKLYQKEVEKYRKKQEELNKSYEEEYRKYILYKKDYEYEITTQRNKFDEIESKLSDVLSSCYSKDIIYPKYRNLIAVSTIYEYFACGRCNELEGPNGAYNLYESELRSNIIINSLSQIVSDLDQIKNGQYALYETINNSNEVICEMLSSINKAQYLTAYFAAEAALAASADRYIIGRTYTW